jgi:hypothetical protein
MEIRGSKLMRWRIHLWSFALVLFSQSAHSEGFKCTLNHVTRVGADGSYQDGDRENLNVDFFLAIDNKARKGTSSICTKSGCTDSDIVILEENDSEDNILRSMNLLTDSGAQLWSLESYRDPNKYRAVAVSINGQLSVSRFGECTRIIQQSAK